MLHGALAGADEVHAVSPQTCLSFAWRWRAGDHRWRRYVWPLHFRRTRHYHDLRPWLERCPMQTQLHVYFARDSRLDALHARHVYDVPRLTIHERAEGSHRLVSAMRESGELRAIFTSHAFSFAGSRSAVMCFQAYRNVSCAMSSVSAMRPVMP